MHAAVLRYRVMAYITGVVHGILYIIYLVVAYLLARRLRLPTGPTVLVLLAGTIPVLTFVVERWLTRRYINPALAAAPSAQPVSR